MKRNVKFSTISRSLIFLANLKEIYFVVRDEFHGLKVLNLAAFRSLYQMYLCTFYIYFPIYFIQNPRPIHYTECPKNQFKILE
jgi:hypothetical protein